MNNANYIEVIDMKRKCISSPRGANLDFPSRLHWENAPKMFSFLKREGAVIANKTNIR